MKKQSGQVLLIIAMLLATAITVVLSVSFTSMTETKITKLEEESQKALAAAEAGIEASLKQGTVADLSTLPNLDEFKGNATVSEINTKTVFVSPLLQKDEQYTFYLYDKNSPSSPPYNGELTVYYGSSEGTNCNDLALELTIIYDNPATPRYEIKRYVADTQPKLGSLTDNIGQSIPNPGTIIDGQKFYCRTSSGSININPTDYPNAKFLIVRALFSSTKIGFQNPAGTTALMPQGKTVNSEAQTQSGVTKKVQLFQSYPQIPSEFFVTSF